MIVVALLAPVVSNDIITFFGASVNPSMAKPVTQESH